MAGAAALATAPPANAQSSGEWSGNRGNSTLDGRVALRGDITQPRIVWKQFVGAIETWLVATPGEASASVRTPPSDAQPLVAEVYDAAWGREPPTGELEGRAQPICSSTTTAYAHVLPDARGLQKLEFESGFGIPTVNGQWQPAIGRCFKWEAGKWVKVWQTDPIDLLFQPLPIVGDFDGDGNPEVAILPWKELLILDARTGRIKDRCKFTEARSYGFFGVYALDHDGRSEFVVQADFCKHVDVLGYRNGKLALLWQREIEPDISNPQKVMRVHPDPVADVDGDGKLEVLVDLYNGTGDGRWHVTVHDGMTGRVKADLVDETLVGIADVNGDGAAELLTTRTSGGGVPEYGQILVHSVRDGKAPILWQREGVGWQTWDAQPPPNTNSAATFARRDVLHRTVDGHFTAVLREPRSGDPGRVALTAVHWEQGGLKPGLTVTGKNIAAAALDARGRVLLRSMAASGAAADVACTAGLRCLGSQPVGGPPGPVAVAQPVGEAAMIVAQGTGEELAGFRAPVPGRPSRELWRIPGRGQYTNWPNQPLGPVVADLRGDGRRACLYATAAPRGCARFVAADVGGRELWHHGFPAIPGTPPVWNTGGIILWQTGHFTDLRGLDVAVTVRRSMMHSEETYLLAGKDGREIWHRAREISNRGVGGTPFAIADFDGDGLDDIASLHPSIIYIIKGSTGRDILAKDATWSAVPAKPVYWGIPIAEDFEGTGKESILFATERASMTGLVRADGSLVWWDALDHSPKALPAVGDFDGDGKLEAVGIGYDDGTRCYNAATGVVKWRLPFGIGQTPTGMASADINGDGRDEAVCTMGNTLYCLGTEAPGRAGKLLWQLDLPAVLGPPGIADVDGRGKASILVAGSDGYVYCVR